MPRGLRGVRPLSSACGASIATEWQSHSPEAYLADLNPAQREAVLTTEGPLLVVAGAGSGKTRVLTHRVAHLINAIGVKPQEILAITFTNKAAGEMRERLEDMLGGVARAIWILTFHSACGRILRREAPRLGYRSNFTIYDQADQIRLDEGRASRSSSATRSASSRAASTRRSRPRRTTSSARRSTASASRPSTTRPSPTRTTSTSAASSPRTRVDFDDMLFLTVQLLENFPEAREKWQQRVPLHPRRRVPGHEPRAVPAPAAHGRKAQEPVRRRRSGPVDLRLPRSGHPQHHGVRGATFPGRA